MPIEMGEWVTEVSSLFGVDILYEWAFMIQDRHPVYVCVCVCQCACMCMRGVCVCVCARVCVCVCVCVCVLSEGRRRYVGHVHWQACSEPFWDMPTFGELSLHRDAKPLERPESLLAFPKKPFLVCKLKHMGAPVVFFPPPRLPLSLPVNQHA